MIDLIIRSETRLRFLQFLVSQNLVTKTESSFDPEGAWNLREGVDISPDLYDDQSGFAIVTPAVYEGTTLVTPAVKDTWWTATVRLSRERAAQDIDNLFEGEADQSWKFLRSRFVAIVRRQGVLRQSPWGGRAYQIGTTPNRIQLLDPRDHPPQRVWAGGMSL